MRKITFLIALMLSAMLSAYAQPVSGYTRTVLTGQTYTPIAGGTVINTVAGLTAGYMSVSQDDGAVLVTLPFTFNYAGNSFTQVTFCTNGWIGMGAQSAVTAAQSRAAGNLWTTTAPNNVIAPWFGDLGANFPTGGGSMVHGTVGTDVYAFEWQNAVANGFTETTANRINFMVKIYGPASSNPGRIEFLYGSTIGTVNTGRAIGLEDATGGAGNFINALNGSSVSTATSSAWPGNGTGYRFDPGQTTCSTLSGGAITAVLSACSGSAPAQLDPIGATAPITGITYAWEQSTDGGTSWVAAVGGTGATTRYYTPPAYAGTPIKYRLKVSCGSEVAYSNIADFSGPAAPFTQASNLSFTPGLGQFVVNFTAGNGTRRIVVVSQSPISDPENVNGGGAAITAAAAYAGGEQIVYDGTGSSVTVTGIPCSGGTYYVKVFEYTRCGTAGNYTMLFNTTTGTNASTLEINPLAAPTTQASNAVIVPGTGQFTVNWTNGNGNYRFVYIDTNPIADPIDEVGIPAPTANTVFQNNGLQLVYNGTGSSVTVTSLPCAPGDTYYVKVFEVNRCGVTGAFDYVFNTTTTTNGVTYTLGAPTTQVSGLTVTPGLNSATVTWVNGNGVRRRVIVSDVPISDPADEIGVAEITGATFYQGGQQNVYDGTGTTFNLTGLSCNTTYYIRVYEYFRCGTTGDYSYLYNTAVTAANGTTFTTTGPMTAVALPQATAFTGFTGDNLSTVSPGWKESAIPTPALTTPLDVNPSGTTSSWTNSSVLGSPTARVNLYGNTRNEWIISPRVNMTAAARLKFKAAMTNWNSAAVDNNDGIANTTDDKVTVLISNDPCGVNWQAIYEFNSSNALTNQLTQFEFAIDPSYIGQQVYIAFHATDGPTDDTPDYDFHIGDVIIELVPQCDVPTLITDSVSLVTENGATVAWAGPSTGNPTGYQYVFSTSNTAPAGAGTEISTTGITVNNLSSSTEYFTWVRTVCGSLYSNWVMVGKFTTLCDAPEILTTTPATRCGIGTATLAATSDAGTISWYAAQTGGVAIATGPSFTTPSINTTTTYYVEASSGAPAATLGPVNYLYGGTVSTVASPSTSYYAIFNSTVQTKIQSVTVYATAAGQLNLQLANSAGTVLQTFNYTITAAQANSTTTVAGTPIVVPVNFDVPVGTGLRLGMATGTTATLLRNTSGATPYYNVVAGGVSFTGNWFADNTYWYFFYDIKINAGCSSARVPVTATVTTAPEITASVNNAAICAGQPATLSATSSNSNYTYVWMPGNLTGAQQTVNPATTTTYTVTGTDPDSNCVATATVTVTVNALPTALTASLDVTVCPNGPAKALTVTGGVATGTIFTENFNAATNNWITVNNSTTTGTGNINSAAWTLLPNNSAPGGDGPFISNDASQFYQSNIDNAGSGSTVNTALQSPAFSTVGYTSASVKFFHHFYEPSTTPSSTGKVEASLDGTTWTTLQTYGTTQGTATSFAAADVVLTPEFLNKPVVYVRFKFDGGWRYYWSIDNVSVSGMQQTTVTWAPTAGLYTDAAATNAYSGGTASIVYALPSLTTTYTATATASNSCSVSDSVVVTLGSANTPTGETSQVISVNSPAEATIEDIVVAETGVLWYYSLADAVAGVNAIPAGTQLQAGTVYYGTLPGGSCAPLAVTITEILGSKGFNKAQFSYYPNPVKDMLNLKYSNEISGVEVYNLLGQRVLAKQVNATEATVDMSGIAEGNYIVRVTSGNSVETIKIVKKQ